MGTLVPYGEDPTKPSGEMIKACVDNIRVNVKEVIPPAPPDTTSPTISNLTPADGSFTNNPTPTISATVSDEEGGSGINPSSIQMILDGNLVSHSYDSSTGLVSYTPTTPLLEGLHTVNLSVSDNSGNTASASWSFTVDTTYPIVSVSHTPDTPNNLQQVEFTVSVSDNIGIIEVQLFIDNNLVQTWNNAGTFTYTTGPFTEGQHTYYAKAKDLAGNERIWRFQFCRICGIIGIIEFGI